MNKKITNKKDIISPASYIRRISTKINNIKKIKRKQKELIIPKFKNYEDLKNF